MNTYSIFSKINSPKIREAIVKEKLSECSTQEPRIFLQYSATQVEFRSDERMQVDEEGDSLRADATIELMKSDRLRVLIPEHTSLAVAIRQLKKIVKWMESEPDHIYELSISFLRFDDDIDSIPF